jgi:hypothetical protein
MNRRHPMQSLLITGACLALLCWQCTVASTSHSPRVRMFVFVVALVRIPFVLTLLLSFAPADPLEGSQQLKFEKTSSPTEDSLLNYKVQHQSVFVILWNYAD